MHSFSPPHVLLSSSLTGSFQSRGISSWSSSLCIFLKPPNILQCLFSPEILFSTPFHIGLLSMAVTSVET
jgi:hypothetical protein